jgi:hypothetical protein
MALTAGVLSQVSVSSNGDSLSSTAASGGTGPYTEQWYRSQVSGFTPGPSNLITGATSLSLVDSGLLPSQIYYYKVVYTDTGNGNVTVTSAQLQVNTLVGNPSQNQFAEQPLLGDLDMRFNYETFPVQFDPAGSGTLVPGQAVVFSTSVGGIPRVVPSTLQSDVIAGFVNYDVKSQVFNPGDKLEISAAGNVMYLNAVAAINRGQQVTSLIQGLGGAIGGVIPAVSMGGIPKVGYALDSVVSGQLVRIRLQTPAFTLS